MLTIELAQHLEAYARGDFADTLTRAAYSRAITLTIVAVRRSATGQQRTTVSGVHVHLPDEDTAVALACGGVLLRDPDSHPTFRVAAPEKSHSDEADSNYSPTSKRQNN